jgi:hypothetical protein
MIFDRMGAGLRTEKLCNGMNLETEITIFDIFRFKAAATWDRYSVGIKIMSGTAREIWVANEKSEEMQWHAVRRGQGA